MLFRDTGGGGSFVATAPRPSPPARAACHLKSGILDHRSCPRRCPARRHWGRPSLAHQAQNLATEPGARLRPRLRPQRHCPWRPELAMALLCSAHAEGVARPSMPHAHSPALPPCPETWAGERPCPWPRAGHGRACPCPHPLEGLVCPALPGSVHACFALMPSFPLAPAPPLPGLGWLVSSPGWLPWRPWHRRGGGPWDPSPQCPLDHGGFSQISLGTSCLWLTVHPVNLTSPGCCQQRPAHSFSQPETNPFSNKLFRQNSTLHDFNSWDKTVVCTVRHSFWPSVMGVGGQVGGALCCWRPGGKP